MFSVEWDDTIMEEDQSANRFLWCGGKSISGTLQKEDLGNSGKTYQCTKVQTNRRVDAQRQLPW